MDNANNLVMAVNWNYKKILTVSCFDDSDSGYQHSDLNNRLSMQYLVKFRQVQL